MTVSPVFLALALAGLQNAGSESGPPTLDVVELVRQVQSSVVVLHLYSGTGGPEGLGSGFVVTNGRVATARHGLVAATAAEIELADGRRIPVEGVCAADAENDLALLAVGWPEDVPPPPALPLAETVPPAGTPVLAFGSPLGLGEAVSDGLVSAVGPRPGLGQVLTISAPISPGSSGGPVVDRTGQVVGIVRGVHPEGQNVNFAAPAVFLRALHPGVPVPLAEWSARVRAAEPSPEVAEAIRQAMLLLEQGDAAAALAQAERARAMAPAHAPAWHVLAICQERLGQLTAALRAYQRAVQLAPPDPELLTNMGVLLGRLGQDEAEVQAYQAALGIDAAYIPALHNLGVSYEEHGQLEWAAHYFRLILKHSEGDPDALAGLGRVAGRRGRHAEAARMFERVLEVMPEDVGTLKNLASAYTSLGRKEEALQVLRRCLELAPRFIRAREAAAHLLGELGRKDEQYAELKEILRREPSSVEAHYLMGLLLLERGQRAEAFAEYRILRGLDAARADELLDRIYPE